uniref:Transmembrane protein n=1 Tax=viral metagenome TaxID=1070528 RepID=A0A6C0DHU4_9ZZZZ
MANRIIQYEDEDKDFEYNEKKTVFVVNLLLFVLNLISLLIVLLYYNLSSVRRYIFFILFYCFGVILKLFDIIMTVHPYSEGFAILHIISMICALLIISYSLSVFTENRKKIGNDIVINQICSFVFFVFCAFLSIPLQKGHEDQIHLNKETQDFLLVLSSYCAFIAFFFGLICLKKL